MITDQELDQLIDEYRDSPRVNQSLLKQLIEPDKASDKDYSERMGTIVDLRLYTPYRFQRLYYVAIEDTAVSAEVKQILRDAATQTNNAPLEDAKPVIVGIARAREYMKNIKTDDKLLNNILVVKNGQKYYEALLEANGRIVISNMDFGESSRILTRFKAAMTEMNQVHPGEILMQFALYFEYNGVLCKGLLDFVIDNQQAKTLKIVDTKVTDVPHGKYRRHAIGFRYDFQLAFYYIGLKWLIENNAQYKGYTLLQPSLLVHSSVTETIVEYLVTPADLQIGQFGAETKSEWRVRNKFGSGMSSIFYRKTEVLGFDEAIDMYKEKNAEPSAGDYLIQSLTTDNEAYTVSTLGLWAD